MATKKADNHEAADRVPARPCFRGDLEPKAARPIRNIESALTSGCRPTFGLVAIHDGISHHENMIACRHFLDPCAGLISKVSQLESHCMALPRASMPILACTPCQSKRDTPPSIGTDE
ncbi:MAG: hypothetical protein R6U99_08910 [Nioella sp.]